MRKKNTVSISNSAKNASSLVSSFVAREDGRACLALGDEETSGAGAGAGRSAGKRLGWAGSVVVIVSWVMG